MAKTPIAISPTGKNEKANQVCCCICACTIPIMLSVPVPVARLVSITAETTVMLMAISYDTICAPERKLPISE
jgi:hypothetical protein